MRLRRAPQEEISATTQGNGAMTSAGNNAVAASASDTELKVCSAGWSTGLGEAAAQLKEVAGTTECEFLAIGGRLQDFYQRGCGISSLAFEMVGEVAGEQVCGAMDRLARILDGMGLYVDNARREIERNSATLREILGLLDQVAVPLSGFKKVDKVLRMLGISTKIESARLGQRASGFDTLASDVADLAVQVSDKAGVILTRKDELARAIGQTLTGALDSGAQQHGQVLLVLERTRGSLAALTAINRRCSSAASGIAAVSEEVARNVGSVVMSMQAHDMVRQQIEHVDQTLSELRLGLETGRAGADEVGVVCQLQTAQLRHAAAELDAAVQTIIGNLREVAEKQSGLSRETSSMAGLADQTGGGFFAGMQKDIASVSVALLESSRVNQSLFVAMGAVAATVGEISNYVGDIETIGEEIKLIALNAQIKSAYTGEEGAALGVLAEAIQRLSIEAMDHTDAVSGTLQHVMAVKEDLNHAASAETSQLEGEVRGMVSGLGALLDQLQGVNETLHDSLARMDAEVTLLSSDINRVTAEITVHHKVSKVLQEAVRVLEGIGAEARRMAPDGDNSANLAELAGRYTMHSERKIHESLFQASAACQACACADEGLGENVELF
jgi:methyl-accepting chemotaxis protein